MAAADQTRADGGFPGGDKTGRPAEQLENIPVAQVDVDPGLLHKAAGLHISAADLVFLADAGAIGHFDIPGQFALGRVAVDNADFGHLHPAVCLRRAEDLILGKAEPHLVGADVFKQIEDGIRRKVGAHTDLVLPNAAGIVQHCDADAGDPAAAVLHPLAVGVQVGVVGHRGALELIEELDQFFVGLVDGDLAGNIGHCGVFIHGKFHLLLIRCAIKRVRLTGRSSRLLMSRNPSP